MSAPQVNGDVPRSSFLKHLFGYHIVHDGIETFKSNPYGAKSIQLSDSAYQTFAAPIVPYFNGPYQYVQPYVKKADDLGDKALSKVDERFPVVKKPTNELYTDAKGIILFPYHKGIEGRDHVLSLYSDEYKKANGGNDTGFALISTGKAAITTALVLTTETVKFIGDFLGAKKEEAHNAVDNKVNNN